MMSRIAAVTLLVCSMGLAQDLVDNPVYKSWAKHKPGTSVTMSLENSMNEAMKTTLVQTLKSVSETEVVVEQKTEMEMSGQKMPAQTTTLKFPAKTEKKKTEAPEVDTGDAKMKESTEELTVAGKKYKCKVWTTETKASGATVTSKVWWTEEVPGCNAKTWSKTTGPMTMETTTLVTSIVLK
jgi:hypothetical protein